MVLGTVKEFNVVKGFGFIVPDDEENDVFVHGSALKVVGLITLTEGQKIQ